MEIKTDILYAEKLYLDLYVPENPRGAVIDVHGGGWFRGDKAKDADWATRFAEQGYLTIVPNYRLAPEVTYPAPIEDLEKALAWLKASAYPFDREKIAVAGSSSGGNLAIELGLRHQLPVISLSGVIEIDNWLAAHPTVVAAMDTSQDFDHTASAKIDQGGANDAFYKWFVLNYVPEPQAQKDASLLHRIDQTAPPMFLANAMHELVPTSGVLALQAALTAQDVPSQTAIVTGTQHAKGYLDVVNDSIFAFLTTYL